MNLIERIRTNQKLWDADEPAMLELYDYLIKLEIEALKSHPVNVTYELTMEKCLQQQAEIDFLKKEILEKHEDWKHEGQQAANARAEIETLKLQLHTTLTNRNLRTYDGKYT